MPRPARFLALCLTAIVLPIVPSALCKQKQIKASPPRAKAHSRKPKLHPEEPRFDTAYLPRHTRFELEVKETQILNHPSSLQMLHAKVQVVQLQAAAHAVVLRGKVATEEQPSTPVKTLEHGIRAPFDFQKLVAKIAPDLAWQLDMQIAAARRREAAEAARQEKSMEYELQARKPNPDIPHPATTVNLAAALSRQLQSKIARSYHNEQQTSRLAEQQMQAAMSSRGAPVAMPLIRGQAVAFAPIEPAHPRTNEAEDEFAAALAHARNHHPAGDDLDAKIAAARQRSQSAVMTSQPAMDMVLTYLRKVTPQQIPVAAPSPVPGDAVDVIVWDSWHFQFAKLARGPILAALKSSNNPSGADTVEITVERNQQLSARLIAPSSSRSFDEAILKAYRSLSGSAQLQFPAGSQRKSISFQIDNEHKGTGAPSGVNSTTTAGDKEMLHRHI